VDESTEQLNRVFTALADPTRRDLVARLASAEATVDKLAEPHDMSLQAISKHVRQAGLPAREGT
jgi:DNA-binding transcriptional ArsR family regulator